MPFHEQRPLAKSLDNDFQEMLMSGIDHQIYRPFLTECMLGIATMWLYNNLAGKKVKENSQNGICRPTIQIY